MKIKKHELAEIASDVLEERLAGEFRQFHNGVRFSYIHKEIEAVRVVLGRRKLGTKCKIVVLPTWYSPHAGNKAKVYNIPIWPFARLKRRLNTILKREIEKKRSDLRRCREEIKSRTDYVKSYIGR